MNAVEELLHSKDISINCSVSDIAQKLSHTSGELRHQAQAYLLERRLSEHYAHEDVIDHFWGYVERDGAWKTRFSDLQSLAERWVDVVQVSQRVRS